MARVAEHVRKARELWRQARNWRDAEWPDQAVRLEGEARRQLKIARWVKLERRKAGVAP